MRSAPIVCSEESPLPASVYDNYAVRRFAAGGLVRRLWLGRGIWCPMGFSPASVPEGFQRASGKPFGEPAGAYPCWGLTRRLRRGSGTCRPMGRSPFSFDGERKVCKRKPAARRLREKALYCPFLKEGVRNVARSMVKLTTFTFVRARAHSFPLSKRARLFPSAAYRRSVPPQLALGRLNQCELGCYGVGWMASLYP